MAFNPFDVFRRNQRILFAALTTVIMFMFVLSFGQGDFFSMVPRWLAQRSRTGEVLAVVDGAKVYQSQLGDLDVNRLIANEYMNNAARICAQNLEKSVNANIERVSATNKPTIETALRNIQSGFMPNALQAMQIFQQFGFGSPPSEGELIAEREGTLSNTIASLQAIERAPNPAEVDVTAARNLLHLIEIQQRASAGRGRNPVYFFNVPNNTTKDRMDFFLWLKEADQLGIHYTDADVIDLANNEFYRKLSNDDWAAVESAIRGKQGYTVERLRAALGDEFRVRAAQAAVLGQSFLIPEGRSFASPTDFYEFYKKQLAPATYTLVSIPANLFLDKVTGSPDETTRREIFQQGRNEDPNPGVPTFGLREPRKLKIGYLSITGEEPIYKEAAEQVVKEAELLIQLGGYLLPPLGGVANFTTVSALCTLNQQNLLTDSLYNSYKNDHASLMNRTWLSMFPTSEQVDTNQVQPLVPINLITAYQGTRNPLIALAGYFGTLALADEKTRLNTLPAAFAQPILPGLMLFNVACGALVPTINASLPLPQADVKSLLLAKLRKQQIESIATQDIQKFSEELASMNASSDSPEAKKKIEDFVTSRGIQSGGSNEFRDLYSIYDDEGLTPLREKAAEPNPFNPQKLTRVAFGNLFFNELNPTTRTFVPSTGFFKPQPISRGMLPNFYFYRTAELAAEPLRDPNSPEARAKTEAAWKRRQARDLARKAANELAEQAKNLGSSTIEIEQKFNQLVAEYAEKIGPEAASALRTFKIDDVAPVVATTSVGFQPRRQIGSFALRQSENIEYPTSKMATELVANKDKPLGTTILLNDNPTEHYYVAVLTARREQSIDEFRLQVYGPASVQSEFRPIITQRYQDDLRNRKYEAAIELLKSEFGYTKENQDLLKEREEL